MQANPLLQVQVKLTTTEAASGIRLIQLLLHASVVEHADKPYTLLVNPPKGTTNNVFWAEQVYKYCLEHNIPALIVRPERNASEVAS